MLRDYPVLLLVTGDRVVIEVAWTFLFIDFAYFSQWFQVEDRSPPPVPVRFVRRIARGKHGKVVAQGGWADYDENNLSCSIYEFLNEQISLLLVAISENKAYRSFTSRRSGVQRIRTIRCPSISWKYVILYFRGNAIICTVLEYHTVLAIIIILSELCNTSSLNRYDFHGIFVFRGFSIWPSSRSKRNNFLKGIRCQPHLAYKSNEWWISCNTETKQTCLVNFITPDMHFPRM